MMPYTYFDFVLADIRLIFSQFIFAPLGVGNGWLIPPMIHPLTLVAYTGLVTLAVGLFVAFIPALRAVERSSKK